MKHSIVITLLIIFGPNFLLSQNCFPQGITFETQEQIEIFPKMYPNCTEIEGAVRITGNNINNLKGLFKITRIGASLNISDCNSLTDLEGLHNLTYIGGDLSIANADKLKDLSGLDKLYEIGGALVFMINDNLQSLSGIKRLHSLGKGLFIGVPGPGDFGNPNLECLHGLDSLTSIGGTVYIFNNHNLTCMKELQNVRTIDGGLVIYRNDELLDLSGFSNLETLAGKLTIVSNSSLQSLYGLENLEANSIKEIAITRNENLSECDVQVFCDYLSDQNGKIRLEGNAEGCNDINVIKQKCLIADHEEFDYGHRPALNPNPASNEFVLDAKGDLQAEEISVFNQSGQCVFRTVNTSEMVDVSALPSGIYYVVIITPEKRYTEKLVIRK